MKEVNVTLYRTSRTVFVGSEPTEYPLGTAYVLLFLNYLQMRLAHSIFSKLWTYFLPHIFENTHFKLWSSFWDLDIFHSVMGKEIVLIFYFYFVPLVWYFDTWHTISNRAKNKRVHLYDVLTEQWRGSQFLLTTERRHVQLAGRSDTVYWMLCIWCVLIAYLWLLYYPILFIFNFIQLWI